MPDSKTGQAVQESFFRDYVDNSSNRLGEALLTDKNREVFTSLKGIARANIYRLLDCVTLFALIDILESLPNDLKKTPRETKLLGMAMIKLAVEQVLSEIAMKEDQKS